MIDLTDLASRVNIGVLLMLIATLLLFNFFAKFPTKGAGSKTAGRRSL